MQNRFALPVIGLLFISGMCALVFQVTWLREFRLVFGASTPASAAVLAIFMGGLGAGNALLGQRADHAARPLRLYAALELVIAVSAAASPWLVDVVRWLYIAVGGQPVLGLFGAAVVRLFLATLVMGIPTLAMGGTLPAAARAVTLQSDVSRRDVALLYGLNALGAVTGTLLSTFFLVERFGTRQTLWMAAALNLGLAATAYGVSIFVARAAAGASATPIHQPDTVAKLSAETEESGMAPAWFVYTAAGVVGFAFFLMELVWFRMLGPILGGTTFTFGLILAVALTGIGMGGAAYSLLFRDRRPTLLSFGLTCGLEAAAIAVPYALGDRIAVLALVLKDLGVYGFVGEVVGWLAVTSAVVLVAALVAGLQFPILIALLGSGSHNLGRQVGYAFACNTAGAIAGSMVGGFGALPVFTAPGTWRAVVVLLALLGLAAVLIACRRQRRVVALIVPVGVTAVALACLFTIGPTAVWRHTPIGAGRAVLPSRTQNDFRRWQNDIRRSVIWEADGRELSVALSISDDISFVVNGKVDGSFVGDASTQVMLGLVGAVLHPDPRRCLVVGLGTGESAGWLADVSQIERVDVVELEPAIAEVARAGSVVNRDVLNHPRVNLMYNDAREVLLTTRQQYDLIASEPSNPYRAGVASLFTAEFYAAARNRLATGGLFLQWLQAYEIDDASVYTVLATLRSEFAHVEIWQTNASDLLLVCSTAPVEYAVERMRERITTEPFQTALRVTWGATDFEGFLARYVAGVSMVEALRNREDPPINTDDRNYLEYGSARGVGREIGFSIERLRKTAIEQNAHRPRIDGDVEWGLVDDNRVIMYYLRERELPRVITGADPELPTRVKAYHYFQRADMRNALAAWASQSRPPRYPTELAMLAMAHAEGGDARAEPILEQLAQFDPIDAEAIRAYLRWKQNDPEQATAAVERTLRGLRNNPWPANVGHVLPLSLQLAKGNARRARRLLDALDQPLAASLLDDSRRATAVRIANLLGPEVLRVTIASFEPHVVWTREFLEQRFRAYSETGDPRAEQARDDLDAFNRNAPNDDLRSRSTGAPRPSDGVPNHESGVPGS